MAKAKRNNVKRRVVRVKRPAPGRTLDARAIAYRNLLLDPCNAPLVPPVGLGPSSGLLVRQKYVNQLTGELTVADPTQASNFHAILRPALGTLTFQLGNTGGRTIVLQPAVDLETGILTSARAYRAVAACLKFIPFGPLGLRSGTISMGYVPDDIQDLAAPGGGAGVTYVDKLRAMASRTVGNGGSTEIPEVKWIPSGPEDLEFRQKGVIYHADSGAAFMVGVGIDAPTKGTTTGMALNGYLETTIVWEWVPAYDSGVVSTVQPTSANSFVEVLASIGKDLSATLTSHAQAMAVSGMKRFARDAVIGGITGIMANSMAGPSLLTAY